MKNEIVLYQPDSTVRMEVLCENDSVWLTKKAIGELFGVNRSTVSRHLKNIFEAGELISEVVCAKIAHTTQHGALSSRSQTRTLEHYNLDAIISVGYRVNSLKATQFRQWATGVLRDYLLKGHAINQRFERLEQKVDEVVHEMEDVQGQVAFFVRRSLPPIEGVYYEGQIFDAYEFVSGLIRSARKRIVLVDNYVDETVLGVLAKRRSGVEVTIYVGKLGEALKADVAKYNEQYSPVVVERTTGVHDRFLIVDGDVYHLGASVKDLGKKLFAFSKLGIPAEDILKVCAGRHT